MVRVQCVRCEMKQPPAENCRRCGRPLPKLSPPVVVERIVEVPVFVPCFDLQSESFPTISELEKTLVISALRITQGDIARVAKMLGIGKTTVYRKLREYGVTVRVGRDVILPQAGSDLEVAR